MAPYGGPSLIEVVKLLAKGQLPHALGSGLPRAQFRQGEDAVLELRGLSGGEGFGVQADLVNPFVDSGTLVRGTWQEVVAWLCEHWDYGDAWGTSNERLHVRFIGERRALTVALRRELQIGLTDAQRHADQGIAPVTLDELAAACRAARTAGAQVDFDVVKLAVNYDVVVEDCGGKGAAFYATIKDRVAISHAVGLALTNNEPAIIYSTDREDFAKHAYDVASKVRGVRVKLVVRRP
jgi:hypothetical protein